MKNLFALLLCLCTTFSLYSQAPNANWEPDWDGDNLVGVNDLLGLLGVFGDEDVDNDGVWDSVDECIDTNACNFDLVPSATCTYLDAIGVCGGICELDENQDGICDFICGVDSIQYFGTDYPTVQIEDQCWLAKNLASEFYSNGVPIPNVTDNSEWASMTSAAQCAYENTDSNVAIYGRLYNYYAFINDNICPTGWHRSSMAEWQQLFYEAMAISEAGLNLKSSGTDTPTWDGLNIYGFSAQPSGRRLPNDGAFEHIDYLGEYWTNSVNGVTGRRTKYFVSGNDGGFQSQDHLKGGHSIRCIKD